MKLETNRSEGWVRYRRDGPGQSPQVIHHANNHISLISPGDQEDKVSLTIGEETFFVLYCLKALQENGLKETFSERSGHLVINYSHNHGLTIHRRTENSKQFHLATEKSLSFIIEALEDIVDRPR